jgi:hypothetical protein
MLYDLQGQEKGHVVIVTGAIIGACVCRLGEPSPVITFSYSSKLAPFCTAMPEATRFEGVFMLASQPFRVFRDALVSTVMTEEGEREGKERRLWKSIFEARG